MSSVCALVSKSLRFIYLDPFNAWNSCVVVHAGDESEDKDSEVESAKSSSVLKCDLVEALKTFIFSVAEKEAKNSLPWQTLLLYLCRDASYERALRKAFTVLATTMYYSNHLPFHFFLQQEFMIDWKPCHNKHRLIDRYTFLFILFKYAYWSIFDLLIVDTQ